MKKLRRNGFITKVWNKKALLIGVIGVILVVICIGGYLLSRDIRAERTSYIKVGGFEVEYVPEESVLTLEDFEQIELGCNLSDIEEKVGELDGWIGSGCSMPVFILQDETAVVCIFYDGFSEDLIKLEWYDGQVFYSNVILEGIECVYGYKNPDDYSGEELLYQRNLIRHVFCWDEDSGEYILVEDSREVLQQVDGVYPVWE